MDFSTSINTFNTDFNLNAVTDYNKFLQGQASFEINKADDMFSNTLENAIKTTPSKNNVENGMGNFVDQISKSLGGGLNAVNTARFEADRMQEDIAMGGPTSIHDAMIAAEKAELSMRMAVQVRNRILDAYTEIRNMSL